MQQSNTMGMTDLARVVGQALIQSDHGSLPQAHGKKVGGGVALAFLAKALGFGPNPLKELDLSCQLEGVLDGLSLSTLLWWFLSLVLRVIGPYSTAIGVKQ